MDQIQTSPNKTDTGDTLCIVPVTNLVVVGKAFGSMYTPIIWKEYPPSLCHASPIIIGRGEGLWLLWVGRWEAGLGMRGQISIP